MAKSKTPKREFSKSLLVQESALMWVVTLGFLILAFYCIKNGYTGSLPWLSAMAGLPWAAYGVSQVYYYKKSLAENTRNGIKYDTVLAELNAKLANTYAGIDIGPDSTEGYSEMQNDVDPWGPI